MNKEIKKIILENEYKLRDRFIKYTQSINQLIKKIEACKYDSMLYNVITRSFVTKDKIEQEKEYNIAGFKSSRQIINEMISKLDLNDGLNVVNAIEGNKYSSLEICSMADNYNNQVGMYYLIDVNSVIIKSTVEDNNRPYDDKWLKDEIILRYCMQNEKEENVNSLNFRNKPNSVIFNSLMNREIFDVYVFVNKKKGELYEYKGVFHPCGIVCKNRAFLLFKEGFDHEIPFDNIEAQFLKTLVNSNEKIVNNEAKYLLIEGNENDFCDSVKKEIKMSKRNIIQQKKIDLEVALRGEEIILQFEKERLTRIGYSSLANSVCNISVEDMTRGYDIKSYDVDEKGNVTDKLIKVKSSVSHMSKQFCLTAEEYNKIINNKGYKLYRVYDIYTDSPKYIDLSNNIKKYLKEPIVFNFSISK